MPEHSRRTFLLAAGAGSVAVGTGATAVLADLVSFGVEGEPDADVSDDQGLVAYVSNPRSGEIVLMRGDRERRITDMGLAASLARLAG